MSQDMVAGMRDLQAFLLKLAKVFEGVMKGLEGFERQMNATI
jgi:hypothetical protein